MRKKEQLDSTRSEEVIQKVTEEKEWDGPTWDREQIIRYIKEKPGRCCLIIDDLLLDATTYLGEHVSSPSSPVSFRPTVFSSAARWRGSVAT